MTTPKRPVASDMLRISRWRASRPPRVGVWKTLVGAPEKGIPRRIYFQQRPLP